MQEKKKILYLITKGNFGGAQRYVYDLATNLPKNKFEVVIACGNGGLLIEKLSAQGGSVSDGKDLNIKTIEIESLEREISLDKDFKVFTNLIKIIKEEKPDVVHLNSSKIGFLGSLVVLYFKFFSIIRNTYPIPHFIFTAHGWAFNEKSRSAFSRFIYYVAHYLTILICDQTIAVSEKSKRDISSLPFIKSKIKVIYNGVKPFKAFKKEEAEMILADENADKTVIFSISELHKNKGIDVALKALSLLPKETKEKIIYRVAANGEEKENLEKLAKDLNIENVVRFLGFVPDAKRLLSGADIFLLPSRTEAFPYSILEAGISGIPIIATCVGGIPEVIHDMRNGILVHPKNAKEITEAILYLLDHKDKQKEFKREIKNTVTNFFSLEKMLSETISLYSKAP